MKFENNILDFVKAKYPKKEIIGIRELKNIEGERWCFRFVYRKGNHLSISSLKKININSLGEIKFL